MGSGLVATVDSSGEKSRACGLEDKSQPRANCVYIGMGGGHPYSPPSPPDQLGKQTAIVTYLA